MKTKYFRGTSIAFKLIELTIELNILDQDTFDEN